MFKQNNLSKKTIPSNNDIHNSLIEQLYNIGVIQFGTFKLKSGITTPIYLDVRRVISYPDVMKEITTAMGEIINQYTTDSICGVPYAGIPLAACIALLYKKPMIMPRKEAKTYGTKKSIEGVYSYNNITLIIEDIITTGSSIKETYDILIANNIQVHDVVVFCDRRTVKQKEKTPYAIHALYTLTDIINYLYQAGKINAHTYESVKKFLTK